MVGRVEATARLLTDRLIRYFGFPEERRDVLTFGLAYLLLFFVDGLCVIVAGLVFHALVPTLTAAFTAAFFRSLTGGAHFSDPWTCAAVSGVVAGGLGALGKTFAGLPGFQLAIIALSTAAVGSAAVGLYAPVDSPAKPIPVAKRAALRRLAWIAIVAWGFAMGLLVRHGAGDLVVASSLGLIWQIVTLTPGGASAYRFLDQVIHRAQ